MTQYIDKSALVAEIERVKSEYIKHNRNKFCAEWSCGVLDNILLFLDITKVKEVDLEEEIEDVKHNYKVDDNRHTSICSADIEWIAKHFFELGLKAQKGE